MYRKITTGVQQGSKLSQSLFSFYTADIPRPTKPVKRVCYADDLTMWATGVKIPDLEDCIHSYLGNNHVPKEQLLVDFYPKVFSYVVQPGHTPS